MGGLFFAAERSYVEEHRQHRLARETPGRRRQAGDARPETPGRETPGRETVGQETVVTPSQIAEQPTRGPMPGRVRWVVVGAIGLALAGALYLISVRGEALLLDLKAVGGAFCF